MTYELTSKCELLIRNLDVIKKKRLMYASMLASGAIPEGEGSDN